MAEIKDVIGKDNSDLRTMYSWMLEREKLYQPAADALDAMTQLDPSMRTILLDWVMEVSQEFALGRETMHLASNYIDRVLTLCARNDKDAGHGFHRDFINRENLQLLGVTCLSIASKLEEIYPPNVVDFAGTTDDAYTTNEIYEMERMVLQEMAWCLHAQTPFSWLKLFVKLVAREIHLIRSEVEPEQSNIEMRQILSVDFFIRVMELVDLAMLDLSFLQFYPSAVAASAMLHVRPELETHVETVSPYSVKQLEPISLLLKRFGDAPSTGIRPPSKQCLDLKIPLEDMFTRQMHNQAVLEYLSKIGSLARPSATKPN